MPRPDPPFQAHKIAERRKQLAAHGVHLRLLAPGTHRDFDNEWSQWQSYCKTIGKGLKEALNPTDVKVYYQCRQDSAVSHRDFAQRPKSLYSYFRRLKQAAARYLGFTFTKDDSDDIRHYLQYYTPHTKHRPKGPKLALTGIDLKLMVHCHWARDTGIYQSERERVQLALMLPIFAYAGLRPMSVSDNMKQGEAEYNEVTAPERAAKLCYGDFRVFKVRDQYEVKLGASFEPKRFKNDLTFAQRL